MKKSSGHFEGKLYFPLVFLCYLGFLIAVFPDVVFFGTSFVKRDILRFYFPVWSFAVECMKQGILPLWNPYNSYGVPFLANVQTCVFYPFQALLYLPSFVWGFNFYILLHVALAGFFTCIWMRDCGASPGASFLSGLAFSMSGYVMSGINLTIALCSLVYFPLVLLCLRRAFRGKDLRWTAGGSIVLLFQYLAGDPAVLFSTLFVCTGIMLFKTAEDSFLKKRLYLKYFFDMSKMVLLFIGLSAFQSLLFAEYLHLSNRAEPSFDLVTMWSLQYNDILSFIFPFFSDISLYFMDYWVRQSWLENGYVGITVFILACAAWRYRKTTTVGYHVLLALLGLGLAMGRFCYLYRILYDWFPFFKFIRYPIRFVYVSHFALACLAGFGLDALLAGPAPDKDQRLSENFAKVCAGTLLFLTGLVIVSMWLSPWISGALFERLHPWMQHWSHLNWTMFQVMDMVTPVLVNMKRCAVFALFSMVGILAARHFKVRKILIAAFFCLIVFGDLVEANITELRVPAHMLDEVGQNMQEILKDKGIYRAQASPSVSQFQFEPQGNPYNLEDMFILLREALSPDLLLPKRIFYSAGYDSLYIKEVFELNSRGKKIHNPAEYQYLNMLNIKYTVSTQKELDGTYRRLCHAGPFYLYRNDKVLDRAFLVPEAKKSDFPQRTLNKILSKKYDPKAWIYLEEDPPAEGQSASAAPEEAEKVTITRYSPGQVDMRAVSHKEQWLFFSDLFYPGWKAFLNGRPVKIYKANYAFRAIRVPVGVSNVEWKYDPLLFRIGLMVTAVTALIIGLIFFRRKRMVPA